MTEQPEWPSGRDLPVGSSRSSAKNTANDANMQAHGGDPRIAEVDAWLRQRLRNELALPPEFVEFEFGRVIDAAFADAIKMANTANSGGSANSFRKRCRSQASMPAMRA